MGDPTITGIHHISITARDAEASAAWYERTFGMTRLPITFPHHDREDTGYALLMLHDSGVVLGIHREGNQLDFGFLQPTILQFGHVGRLQRASIGAMRINEIGNPNFAA